MWNPNRSLCLVLAGLFFSPAALAADGETRKEVAPEEASGETEAEALAALEDEGPQLLAPTQAELDAFQAALERFSARVTEFEDDSRDFVQRRYEEERTRLSSGYEAVLQGLEDEDQALRVLAMERFQRFLVHYGDTPEASGVRLRLAELYFQQADDDWIAASKEYFDALNAAGDDFDKLIELEEMGQPTKDLSEVITLLTQIIDTNRGLPPEEQFELIDTAYYLLAFCYTQDQSAQYNEEAFLATFTELIATRPASDYADAAHMFLGSYYFDNLQLEDAINEFNAVIERGPEHKHFLGAKYQLAWAYYKLSNYDRATDLFVELLEINETRKRDEGKPIDYAPEAVAYLAMSLSDQADTMDQTPLQRANQYFGTLSGERPYRWDVLKEMAESLVRYARPEDAIDIYRYLQNDPAYVHRPENPDFQDQVVKLLSSGYMADLKAAGEARLQMTERYGEGSEWWVANKDNPEALSNARAYIESSMLEVAIEMKVRAEEQLTAGAPTAQAAFTDAATRYRTYLERYPISDDYYFNWIQLADALYKSDDFQGSKDEYKGILKNERYHPFGDFALWNLFRAQENILSQQVGNLDKPFEGARVERTYTSVGGQEIQVMALEPAQQDYIAIVDTLASRDFSLPEDDRVGDLRDKVERARPAFKYIPAQILFHANRYDEARPRLKEIIEQFPQTDEGAYAANLLLMSYERENDSPQVRKWARQFSQMRLGANESVIAEKGEFFQSKFEEMSYLRGSEAFTDGDYIAAADAYLQFADEFPASPNVPNALLSAAAAYAQIGKTSDANDLYERFVKEYPDHEESKDMYFRIASNYEAIFDLPQAVHYFEELVGRFPDSVDAPDALWEASFLKVGMGDHAGAARGFEKYAMDYPEKSDREEVYFEAAEQWEKANPATGARYYRQYLDMFGTQDANRALAAQYRLYKIADNAGDTRTAQAELDKVSVLFDEISATGATVPESGAEMAAEAAFRELQASYDAFMAMDVSRYFKPGSKSEKEITETLMQTMPAQLEEFNGQVGAFVSKYVSFNYITAALTLMGEAQARYEELGMRLEPDPSVDSAMEEAIWQQFDEVLYPFFEPYGLAAVESFEQVLKVAQDAGRHGEWVDRAQDNLNSINPSEYPAVKLERIGETDLNGDWKLEPRDSEEAVRVFLGEEQASDAADEAAGAAAEGEGAAAPANDADAAEADAPSESTDESDAAGGAEEAEQ